MAKTLNGMLYCPVCKGEPVLQTMVNPGSEGPFRVSCKKCWCRTQWIMDADKAMEMWNKLADVEGENNGLQ